MTKVSCTKSSSVDLRKMLDYHISGTTSLVGPQRGNFLKCCKKFILKDGKLLYISKDGEGRITHRTVLLDDAEKKMVFRDVHASSRGGHAGINNTVKKISERFYWVGITVDVIKWIAECDACQKSAKIKTVAPVLQPIKTKGPWEMLGIDLVGPLPETKNGHKYILTVTDLWSKYIEAFPLKNKSAAEICPKLQTLFYRFGPPVKVLTDQGREFCNAINEQLFKMFEVKHMCTLAYHPQTNGQDERTNQTIKRTLSKLVNDNQDDWDDYLEAVLFAWRTTTQATTKFTPFFLMFNRKPRLISEAVLNDKPEERPLSFLVDVEESEVQERIDAFDHVRSCVEDNILMAQEKMKKYYEMKKTKGCKSYEFAVGMEVLARNSVKHSRKGQRLETDWLGPYMIESISNSSVELSNKGKVLKRKFSIVHLKPYVRAPDVESAKQEETSNVRRSSTSNATLDPSISVKSHCLPFKLKDVSNLWDSHVHASLNRLEVSVGNLQLYTTTLQCLKNNWFDDLMMDTSLQLLISEGRNTATETFHVLSAIEASDVMCKGAFLPSNKSQVSCLLQNSCITALNINNQHWILLAKSNQKQEFYIFDPLGNEMEYLNVIKRNWRSLLDMCMYPTIDVLKDFQFNVRMHVRQQDGYNCGPLVIKEAQQYISGLQSSIPTDAPSCLEYRKEIVNSWLQVTDTTSLMNTCIICNQTMPRRQRLNDNVEWLSCTGCSRRCHFECSPLAQVEGYAYCCANCNT